MPVEGHPSCYFHHGLNLFLMIYVDDFKLAGPRVHLKAGWDLVCAAVEMGRQEEAGLFLGCHHERFEETLASGVVARGFKYNTEAYIRKSSPSTRS